MLALDESFLLEVSTVDIVELKRLAVSEAARSIAVVSQKATGRECICEVRKL